MLYSGADLIRTSGQQQERLDRLKLVDPVAPVASADKPDSQLDEQTQGALLRFARFVHKEGEKKKPKPRSLPPGDRGSSTASGNPYRQWAERERHHNELGQMLNVYI